MREILEILKQNGWDDSLIKNIEMLSGTLPKKCAIDYVDISRSIVTCVDSNDVKINIEDIKDYNIFKL